MTDKKFTDEEIIKRLEQCVNRGNRNYDTDIVLDLIIRQKAEIERLKETIEYKDICIEACEYTKSEAVKEFARRLKCGVPQETGVIRCSDIDNLVKEMVGENNE